MNSSTSRRPLGDKFWTPARLLLTAITFALLAAFGFSSCNESVEVKSRNGSATANAPVVTASSGPPLRSNVPARSMPVRLPSSVLDAPLRTLDGKTVKLSDYAGKVVVINFWATWCTPCKMEIPHLVELSNQYKTKGVEVIGLTNEDPEEDAQKVHDYVRNQHIDYTVGWGDADFAMGLMQNDVREVIPQSFVITRDGRVIKRFIGFNPDATPDEMREAVEQALNQS
jgi:thiol-disulfide isomerase/thioredoxin